MYLGKALVSDLLAHCGLSKYFSAGYVSGDVLRTKHSGRLFRHVLQVEGVTPDKVLHIGDNVHADGRRAVQHGIRAVIVRERVRHDHVQAVHRASLEDANQLAQIFRYYFWGGANRLRSR